ALGRTRDAIAAAKVFYNFVRLDETPRAVDLMAECLRADPTNPSFADQWIKEQTAGEATTRPAASTVLPTIRVEPEPYVSMVRKIDGNAPNLFGMDLYH